MNRDITLRITADVIVGVSILFGWWYLAIPIAVLCAWLFPAYWELVAFAFIHDALYGLSQGMGPLGLLYTIVAALILATMHYVKILVR